MTNKTRNRFTWKDFETIDDCVKRSKTKAAAYKLAASRFKMKYGKTYSKDSIAAFYYRKLKVAPEQLTINKDAVLRDKIASNDRLHNFNGGSNAINNMIGPLESGIDYLDVARLVVDKMNVDERMELLKYILQ